MGALGERSGDELAEIGTDRTFRFLVYGALGRVLQLLAMAMAYFIAVANSELDPLSEELNSQAHNRYGYNARLPTLYRESWRPQLTNR